MQISSQSQKNLNPRPRRQGNKVFYNPEKFEICGGKHVRIIEPGIIKLQLQGEAMFQQIAPNNCIGKDVFQFIDHSFERDITSQAYRWSFKKHLITLAPFVSLLRTAFDIHPVPIDTKPISDYNTIKIEVKRRKAKESSPSNQRYVTVVR